MSAELADLQAQLKQLEPAAQRLGTVEKQLEKARARWGEDRAELKQVKNTLAGLVRTLDEAIVRDLEK